MSRTCIEAKRYEIAQINEGKNLHPRRLPVRKKMCYFFMSSSAVLIYFSLDIDFSERKEDIAQLLLRFPQTRTEQNNLKYRGHNYVILGSIQQKYWNRFSPLRFGANTNTDKYKVEDEAEQNNYKYCDHICVILGSRHETVDICWQVERRGQKTVSLQNGFGSYFRHPSLCTF